MKLIVLSDIHGSRANLARVLAGCKDDLSTGARMILLGDIYNHGPRNPFPDGYAPMEVAALLNQRKRSLVAVKGNCDSEVDEMISEFEILPSFYMDDDGRGLYFTHGHKCNPDLPEERAKAGDVVFYGHFHRPSVKQVNGVYYVCVGAVGLSPDGVDKSYVTYCDKELTFKDLDGNVISSEYLK